MPKLCCCCQIPEGPAGLPSSSPSCMQVLQPITPRSFLSLEKTMFDLFRCWTDQYNRSPAEGYLNYSSQFKACLISSWPKKFLLPPSPSMVCQPHTSTCCCFPWTLSIRTGFVLAPLNLSSTFHYLKLIFFRYFVLI